MNSFIFNNYSGIENIAETGRSLLFRAKNGEGSNVIIKLLKVKYPTPSEIARFKQEYEIIKNLDLDGVVKIIEILPYDASYAIVMEDFAGQSLKKYLISKKLEMEDFFWIAIKIAKTLGYLHLEKIIHKDIKPNNILINDDKKIVKITDFGISSVITHANDTLYDSDAIEGTLVYMSPEQTGRMNRMLDYRSDLYSLGITLYEMLTGNVPFKSHDPMEIIHSHIARIPIPPSDIVKTIPKMLSNIVMKLLSKTAEDRYQNSFGLAADLEKCRDRLLKNIDMQDFELGQDDIMIKFNIPQKLYGRENEIDVLMSSFERVADQGLSEMIVISGHAGIGKSSLVHEIHKPIIARRGYFISGKFDQYRKNIPNSAIIQAFKQFVNQIFTEGPEKIQSWKDCLNKALEPNGRVISEVISNIDLIIGVQEAVPTLGPEESQNRFNLVFKNFIKACCSREHPLVLFLDDMQWADSSSLNLVKRLITDPEIKHLMIIGAYRDNEAGGSHMLIHTIHEMLKESVSLHSLELQQLDLNNVNKLLSNFLRNDSVKTRLLAELVYKKTAGNPFFINQFLKTLFDENLVTINPAIGWVWDIEKINLLKVTDNVVELMVKNIKNMPSSTQEVLKIASCFGNWFELESLSKIYGKNVDDSLSDLTVAIREGIVSVKDGIYNFYHDRIHEATYSLIDEIEKRRLHYEIGHYFLGHTEKENLNDNILYIVNHLNIASSMVNSADARIELAELNFSAGIKSKKSTAYKAALHYFKTSIDLIGEDIWGSHYDRALPFHIEAAESAYLCGEFDDTNFYFEKIFRYATSVLDKVKIYEIKMHALLSQNKRYEAVETGIDILKQLKIKFPKNPKMIHIVLGLMQAKIALYKINIENLISRPVMRDPYALAQSQIMSSVSPAAVWSVPNYLPLIIFKSVGLSLQYGNGELSPFNFTAYGFILCTLNDFDTGYRFGNLGIALLEKMNIKSQRSRTMFAMNCYIRHWKEHVRNTYKPLLAAAQDGLETGDLEFSAFNLQIYSYHVIYTGINMHEFEREMLHLINSVQAVKQQTQLNMMNINYQLMLNLMGRSEDPFILKGEAYDEQKMLPIHIAAKDITPISAVNCYKLWIHYLFRKYSAAVDFAITAEKNCKGVIGTFYIPLLYFYITLASIARSKEVGNFERKKMLRKVRKNFKKFKIWAKHAPDNHLHRYYLIEAELARVNGKRFEAIESYNKAIEAARKSEYVSEESLSCELAGRFFLEQNDALLAKFYIQSAHAAYRRWGADIKVKDLELNYPNYFILKTGKMQADYSDSDTIGSSTTATIALDMSTVMKVSRSLAGEIDLEKLLGKIMTFSIENAGAQKGYLILENGNDNKFYIESEGMVDKKYIIHKSISIEESKELPLSIINYVMKTKEPLVLHNASKESLFARDPYIELNKSKSILCSPITYKGKMPGMIYLENNATTHAFTNERLELLHILSTQAAISIENARLLIHRENEARLSREMEIASKIQTCLLPQQPEVKGYEITACMRTADKVGGDYYDIINSHDKDWIIIGDVSGHGVPAGLIMLMTHSAIHTILNHYPDLTPSEIFKIIDPPITSSIIKMKEDKYITMTILAVNKDGKIEFAGLHQDILIYRSGNGMVESVQTDGRWIGIMDGEKRRIVDSSIQLDSGDTMMLFTDGITEAWIKGSIRDHRSAELDMYGVDRLIDVLKMNGMLSSEIIKDAVLTSLSDYELVDDVTMVILKKN